MMSSDKVIAHVQPSCEFLSNCSKEIRSLHRHKKYLHNFFSERNQQLHNGERGKTSIETVGKLLQFSIWKVLIVNKKLLLLICDFSCGRKTKTTMQRGDCGEGLICPPARQYLSNDLSSLWYDGRVSCLQMVFGFKITSLGYVLGFLSVGVGWNSLLHKKQAAVFFNFLV